MPVDDAPPPGYVRAADVATRVGRDGRRVNEWLRRRAAKGGDALAYVVGASGGRELWVPAPLGDAAVTHFGQAVPTGDAPSPAGADPVPLPGDGRTRSDAPGTRRAPRGTDGPARRQRHTRRWSAGTY